MTTADRRADRRGPREWLLERIERTQASIAVIGLGRVGLPFAVETAKTGYRVIGVDRDPVRVAQLAQGSNYLRHVDDRDVIQLVADERLRATADFEAVAHADVIVICIPSPLDHANAPDFVPVRAVCTAIADRLHPGQLVVLENGTYPGVTQEVMLPALATSGLALGREYFVALAPERVDPGNPHFGAANTTRIIAGASPACAEVAQRFYERLVGKVVTISDPRVAELSKVYENTFRAVNVALVNELALLCDKLSINVWDVIDAACTKPFGIMRFEPGPGVGGSGVPDDPQYLAWQARRHHSSAHVMSAAADVNAAMPKFVHDKVARVLNRRGRTLSGSTILLIGIAYKRDVPDVFDSPALRLARLLEDDGATIAYHDPYIPSIDWFDGLRHGSVPLDAETLSGADCVVVATDHSGIDWWLVAEASRAVVDTRNALRHVAEHREKIVQL